MTQAELLLPALPAGSRRTDPSTSVAAESDHDTQRRTNCKRVLLWLSAHPGEHTFREAATALRMDPHEVMRRLNDLRHLGHVDNGMKRRCTVSGKVCQTWRAT